MLPHSVFMIAHCFAYAFVQPRAHILGSAALRSVCNCMKPHCKGSATVGEKGALMVKQTEKAEDCTHRRKSA